ncbi:CBASS cGAMP-activated phospholipase [Auraticoccus monumenti]|uniref:Patatin-like phospholipase n=1 Tax=Auraticoccus monumenti TaxID=675864 RepID=A0A1G6ZSV1_9ACTN|nr:CBASS cGAMP-activated phospholipase [Auraticoccus monumenti]SDE05758.1 Patatin-like phospholipase [Auraticoccus monumenti]
MTGAYASHGPISDPFHGQRFQILALDGGGAKALFTAHVLAHVEEDLGISITDHFDLIAGTSAGGIVALGLGAGLRPNKIADHFGDLVDRVFPARLQRRARLSRLRQPAYDSDVLHEVLVEVLGDRTLGDSCKRLVIPSWDLQRGEVHIFKTRHNERLTRDWRIKMVDVALATTAAPTYFRAARVRDAPLVDGGVWANNPSVLAIGEAVSMLGVPLETIRVLNVGTMEPFTDSPDRLENAGLLGWGPKAASVILNASSRGGMGTAMHLVGFDDFVRFDAPVPPGKFGLDRIKAESVKGYASAISRNLAPEFIAKFADHTAPVFTPLPAPSAPSEPCADALPEGDL